MFSSYFKQEIDEKTARFSVEISVEGTPTKFAKIYAFIACSELQSDIHYL